MSIDLRCYGDDIQAVAEMVPDFDLRSPMDVESWFGREWQAIAEVNGFAQQLALPGAARGFTAAHHQNEYEGSRHAHNDVVRHAQQTLMRLMETAATASRSTFAQTHWLRSHGPPRDCGTPRSRVL